jgi:hypothetical protein
MIFLIRTISELRQALRFFLSVISLGAILSGCAGKFDDVEELSNGNRLLKSSVSTLNGATNETVRAKAEQGANKICQHEGRSTVVVNITTTPNLVTGLIYSEIEFNCVPKIYERTRKN